MMEKIIKKIHSPEFLNSDWDNLAGCYFLTREFLLHLQKYNFCNQRYYELYYDDNLIAGTLVYTLKINVFTFSNIPSPLNLQIIGLPVSVAAPPVIGEPNEFEYLVSEVVKTEHGLILGINFTNDYLKGNVLNLRTLPTIVLNMKSSDMTGYEHSLRHHYRRRIRKIREKFYGVNAIITDCQAFSKEHYDLYLQIMKRTTTRLETLSLDSFKNLPANFEMTTYYAGNTMLCWHVTCKDHNALFYYFGGMNYSFRDQFSSYNNNLLGILSSAFEFNYKTIDFGQTAETAKTRLGGVLQERRMFIYHKNPVILLLFRICRKLINYSKTTDQPQVFKSEYLTQLKPVL